MMFAAFNVFRSPAMQPVAPPEPPMLFEVQLIDSAVCLGTPLTAFTKNPLELAKELLRDRDPAQWDVRIRAVV